MEHTVDDTARALLDFPQSVIDGKHSWDIPDLQRMATLWLMREELHEAIKAAYRFDDGCYSGYPDTEADRVKVTDALAKLAELEK